MKAIIISEEALDLAFDYCLSQIKEQAVRCNCGGADGPVVSDRAVHYIVTCLKEKLKDSLR